VDAELDERSINDVGQTENVIVSQWREISADEQHELRDRFDGIVRPLGFETSLVVLRRANSIALYFICLTLSAVMRLRDRWRSQELRPIVEHLFALFSGDIGTALTPYWRLIPVKRLSWPLTDYERCLHFFSSEQGMQIA